MVSEAPPSREAATISLTWRECAAGEHLGELGDQRRGQRAARDDDRELPPQAAAEVGRASSARRAKVTTIERSEVIHTRLVSGASKSILSLPGFCARATAPFTR